MFLKRVRNIPLGAQIMASLVLGALCGAIFGESITVLSPVGVMFIRLIKIVVVPLVFASITNGVISTTDARSVGRMGAKTMLLFMVSTAASVSIGLVVAMIIQPGTSAKIAVNASDLATPGQKSIVDMVLAMVPTNPFQALAEGEILQVIVFSLLFGIAILGAGEKGKPIARVMESFTEAMFQMVNMIIKTAPVGVFVLIAEATGKFGLGVLLPLAGVISAEAVALVVLAVLLYAPMVKWGARLPLSAFVRHAAEPVMLAFSTSLSSAAFPVSMEAQKRLGVSDGVRGFVIPLGMTMNMNGTSIYLAVCSAFIANVYGIELGMKQMLLIVLSGVIAAIGTAAVPMAGFVMLTMVLETVGLPLEGLALVAGIDRILDMMRTAGNVAGDNVTSVVVAALEGKLDRVQACRRDVTENRNGDGDDDATPSFVAATSGLSSEPTAQ